MKIKVIYHIKPVCGSFRIYEAEKWNLANSEPNLHTILPLINTFHTNLSAARLSAYVVRSPILQTI